MLWLQSDNYIFFFHLFYFYCMFLLFLLFNPGKTRDAHGSLHMTVEALTQPVFSAELLTLSRLIYKCRNQMRHWKGFSRLKQVMHKRCGFFLLLSDVTIVLTFNGFKLTTYVKVKIAAE